MWSRLFGTKRVTSGHTPHSLEMPLLGSVDGKPNELQRADMIRALEAQSKKGVALAPDSLGYFIKVARILIRAYREFGEDLPDDMRWSDFPLDMKADLGRGAGDVTLSEYFKLTGRTALLRFLEEQQSHDNTSPSM